MKSPCVVYSFREGLINIFVVTAFPLNFSLFKFSISLRYVFDWVFSKKKDQ